MKLKKAIGYAILSAILSFTCDPTLPDPFLTPPTNFSYPQTDFLIYKGVAMPTQTPGWRGFADEFSSEPPLPTGVLLDPVYGIISGKSDDTLWQRNYRIKAINSKTGDFDTLTISINVIDSPSIKLQPRGVSLVLASRGEFTIQALGTGLIYQWFLGTQPIPAATSANYIINQTTWADSGAYYCRVTDTLGTVIKSETVHCYLIASPAKALISFGFKTPFATGTIDEAAKTVLVTVPYGTNVAALSASFTSTGTSVKVAGIMQSSGSTVINFTNPVAYTVVAADGTVQEYVVTVVVSPNTAKTLISFRFSTPAAVGVIDEAAKTVAVTVPFGTNLETLVAVFEATGSQVKVGPVLQVSGSTPNNFSSALAYTIFAADNSTRTYIVTVTPAINTAKALKSFDFDALGVNGVVNETAKTISVTVPYNTSIVHLVASFVTTGASVRVGSTIQTSGITHNTYANPLFYSVVAADGSIENYLVTVTIAKNPAKSLELFRFDNPAATGIIDQAAKTVVVNVPFGTNVASLKAIFTTTGFSVKVGYIAQSSGVTTNDFSSPVTYTVTAEDSTVQSYLVTVNIGPRAPSIAAPADSAIGQSVTPTLSWVAVIAASTYHVQVSSNDSFSTMVAEDSTLTEAAKTLTGLDNNTTYYWRVRVKNAIGTSAWTKARFTTIRKFTLTTSFINERGSVSRGPANQNDYDSGTVVTLTANASTNYHFVGWSGDLTGTTNPTTIAMNGDKNVTATFAGNKFFMTMQNGGHGTTTPVVSDSIAFATPYNISVSPNPGYSFIKWTISPAIAGTIQKDTSASNASVTLGTAQNITVSATWRLIAPVITTQPASDTVCIGMSKTFSIGVAGDSLSYVWKKNDITISTSASYTIPAIQSSDDGTSYTCVVTNSVGSVTSVPATLLVTARIIQIAAGYNHSLFVKSDSSLWACGNNDSGQIGDGTRESRTTPVAVRWMSSGVKMIAAGSQHTLILKSNGWLGDLWACGANNFGQLGDSTFLSKSYPVQIKYNSNISFIAAGGYHSLLLGSGVPVATLGKILQIGASLYACGNNEYGQLGNGTKLNQSTFIKVISSGLEGRVGGGEFHTSIASGMIGASTPPKTVGRNNSGQLGINSFRDTATFISLNGIGYTSYVAVGRSQTFMFGSGSLWACGNDSMGQLGDGGTSNKSTLVQIPVDISNNVSKISSGFYHTFFLKGDSTLWACGDNSYGQLGDGTNRQQLIPVKILNGVKDVAAGANHTLILKYDGSVWACGDNQYGQLGLGNTTNVSLPKRVLWR